MTTLLERLQYKVVGMTKSLEALEVFKKKPDDFDLVLTDMSMPQMTGRQLAREIKHIRKDIPVIICTGHNSKEDQQKAVTEGVDGFLIKPVKKSKLSKCLREILDKQQKGHF